MRRRWPDPRGAVERAREIAGPDGAVVATGSIYLIADLVRDEGGPGLAPVSASEWDHRSMDRGDGPSFGAMIGLVAFVVATVILIFFGIGYGLGRVFL